MSGSDRVEYDRLVRGAGAFVADLARDDDLVLRVVRSDIAHGRLRAIDVEAAMKAPGVHAVFHASSFEPMPLLPIRTASRPGLQAHRQPVLAGDRVRYVGEPVAVVVADDAYRAEDAAELVGVDIEPLDAVVHAPAPREVSPESAGGEQLCGEAVGAGDIDAALADAAVLVEESFSVQRHTGLPIETRGLLADWEDVGGPLHLWGPTKFLHFTRQTLAEIFGLPGEAVICHRVDVGGMFGVRGELYPEDVLVPWAARQLGRRVRWVEDRREHLLAINHSREQRHRLQLAVADDGGFLGLRDRAVLDGGAYARPIGARMVINVLESLPGPYRWAAHEATCEAVATNKTPVGTIRAPCTFEATFVRERAIDIAAARLGMSPVALRRRNLVRAEDMPFTVPMGSTTIGDVVYDSGDFPAVFDTVLQRLDYEQLRRAVDERQSAGELAGLGLACFLLHSGIGTRESVELHVDDRGRFRLGTSGVEFGQGLATMLTTVVCEALGVPPAHVDVDTGSTTAHHGGVGTFASRSAIFAGSATHDACQQVAAAARAQAAQRCDVAPDDVALDADGAVVGDEHLTWKELAPLEAVGRHHMDEPVYGFGTDLAVVRVDADTAGVAVERLVVAYDCGRVLDVDGALGQLRGGAVQGLSNTLFEELPYTAEGQPQTTTLIDYLVATAMETPRIETHLLETAPAAGNPLGVKGVGEAGTVGIAAAVANALADALGSNDQGLTDLPFKPDALLPYLRASADGRGVSRR